MSKRQQWIGLALAAIGLMVGAGSYAAWQEREVPRQEPDLAARRDLMRTKLNFSKAIIEGLSLKNFDTIKEAATNVRNVTEGAMWVVHDTPEYNRYSNELKQSLEQLIRAADEKNLEAATLRYFDMTLRCIDCHDYLRQNQL
jgi:hypothetical protein